MHLMTSYQTNLSPISKLPRLLPLLLTILFTISACDAATQPDAGKKNRQTNPATSTREGNNSRAADIPSGVILQYHHIANNTPRITSNTPEELEQHLQYLEDNDFVIWSLDRMIETVRAGGSVPDKTVAITFDDAYLNIYENGFPLLKKRDWPFTMFATTGLIGSNDKVYMTWDQLAEMQEAGALIENHTASHAHLLRKRKNESDSDWKERVRAEIATAGDAIEKHLGTSSDLLAYPYGEYNDDVMEIVESLGYIGLGQQSGPIGENSNYLALPRFPMSGSYSELESVKTKLLTLPLPVIDSDMDPLLPLSETRPSLTLHFQHDDLPFRQLVCYGPSEMDLSQTGDLEFVARAKEPVPVGRSRYNCTMPAGEPERFYWFSQLWIRRNDDGSWYPEP